MVSAVMVQGVRAGVGKTKFTAAVSQWLSGPGHRTAVFKPLAMDDSFVRLPDGGLAPKPLVLIARALGQPVTRELCPVALVRAEPCGPVVDNLAVEGRYHLHVLGESRGEVLLSDVLDRESELWPVILHSARHLADAADVLVIEGVGGVGEADPRVADLGNMRPALAFDARVLLVADMLTGGAYADVVGVLNLLPPRPRALTRAVLMNKTLTDYDRSLVAPGLVALRELVRVPVLGPVPFFTRRSPQIPGRDCLHADLSAWSAYYAGWIRHMLRHVGRDDLAAALGLAGGSGPAA